MASGLKGCVFFGCLCPQGIAFGTRREQTQPGPIPFCRLAPGGGTLMSHFFLSGSVTELAPGVVAGTEGAFLVAAGCAAERFPASTAGTGLGAVPVSPIADAADQNRPPASGANKETEGERLSRCHFLVSWIWTKGTTQAKIYSRVLNGSQWSLQSANFWGSTSFSTFLQIGCPIPLFQA
jgi:hypothetical protein